MHAAAQITAGQTRECCMVDLGHHATMCTRDPADGEAGPARWILGRFGNKRGTGRTARERPAQTWSEMKSRQAWGEEMEWRLICSLADKNGRVEVRRADKSGPLM